MILKYLDKQPTFATPYQGWVADSARVIGDVYLGHKASVWFGAVIRGDNEHIHIGDYTNVQENAVLHTDAGIEMQIGNHVTIGHLAMLHGCTVGDNSLIGIGAVILNDAQIGQNCIIGAKALVTEGKKIPDNSLVMGTPARVIKRLTDSQVAMLHQSAIHYSDRSQQFKTQLQEVALPD